MTNPKPKDLACLVNGHTPPDDKLLHLNRGNCTICGQLLRRSRMWGGMDWKTWWTPINLPDGVEVKVNPDLEDI